MPVITLTNINDTKLGSHPAKEVVGKKYEDNSVWKKAFFANNKKLRDQLADFEVGDIVDVVMEQDGKYWNIIEFKEVDDDKLDKLSNKNSAAREVEKSSTSRVRADGGSRGDDTNRSAAIYLAQSIMEMQPQELDPIALAVAMVHIANDIIYPYIKDGKIPEVVESKPKKTKKGDPLEPPKVE